MQQFVFKGISPRASAHLVSLSKALSVLHGLTYVTPSIVQIAAQKVYTHRIEVASPAQERSFQYGSTLEAIQEALQGITPENITDTAISQIQQPI